MRVTFAQALKQHESEQGPASSRPVPDNAPTLLCAGARRRRPTSTTRKKTLQHARQRHAPSSMAWTSPPGTKWRASGRELTSVSASLHFLVSCRSTSTPAVPSFSGALHRAKTRCRYLIAARTSASHCLWSGRGRTFAALRSLCAWYLSGMQLQRQCNKARRSCVLRVSCAQEAHLAQSLV
jgi:hypothetical protein